MSTKQLSWDASGKRFYESGVSKVALYPQDSNGLYPLGVAWNGVSAITDSPSGAEASPVYADNTKYLNLISVEEYGCSIEAYTYPDEFAVCDGSKELVAGVKIGQQARTPFGLCFRTEQGNDTSGIDYGYKIHLVYGATAAPSEKAYNTINDNPEAISFSWDVTTIPVAVTGFKPTAYLVIDSKTADPTKLAAFEAILYGTETVDPRLPLPDEVKTLLTAAAG